MINALSTLTHHGIICAFPRRLMNAHPYMVLMDTLSRPPRLQEHLRAAREPL